MKLVIMKKNKKYTLTLIYKLDDDSYEHNEKFQKLLGYADGSGSGFGERDMQWDDLTKDKAEKMMEKARAYAKNNKVRGFSIKKRVFKSSETISNKNIESKLV